MGSPATSTGKTANSTVGSACCSCYAKADATGVLEANAMSSVHHTSTGSPPDHTPTGVPLRKPCKQLGSLGNMYYHQHTGMQHHHRQAPMCPIVPAGRRWRTESMLALSGEILGPIQKSSSR